MFPLAYHITWTTYGTWLHGDRRGWVESRKAGIQQPDAERERKARRRMVESAVLLTPEQRDVVQRTVGHHCRIRGWALHALNVRSNHVHVVVTADCAAEDVMSQLKSWCSRRLSDQSGLTGTVAKKAGRGRWWTEHGSTKPIDGEAYLQRAIRYVLDQQ